MPPRSSQPYAAFHREAATLEDAIRTAIRDVQAAGCRVVRSTIPQIRTRLLEVASAQPEVIEGARGHHEIDLVVRGTIDARPVMVVCEVQAAVSPTEVARFMKVIQRLRATHPDQDIRALFFGYKDDRKAREAIVNAGAAMVFTRGVMIPAA